MRIRLCSAGEPAFQQHVKSLDQDGVRRRVGQGALPDPAIIAKTLAQQDGRGELRSGTDSTDNLKVLVKEIVERLAGSEGATLIFKLIT